MSDNVNKPTYESPGNTFTRGEQTPTYRNPPPMPPVKNPQVNK